MKLEKNRFLLVSILSIIFALFSCSVKAEQKSLTSQFDVVDTLIQQGQLKSALRELKRAEKQSYDVWSYLGVYKRYAKLGENEKSEKILKKALKKNKRSIELQAVYSDYLNNRGRFSEAEKLSIKLKGGKYGSIYSEAVLRSLNENPDLKGKTDYYKNPEYYDIYLDAWNGSKNPIWLKNCAVFNLKQGFYEKAAALRPSFYSDADDAFFWSLVLYDAARYYDAIAALEMSEGYLKDYPDSTNRKLFKAGRLQLTALKADAYLAISDAENAESTRRKIMEEPSSLNSFTNLSEEDEKLLSMLTVNSAIYAADIQNTDREADLLFYAVNRWPEYVPGLILYSDFAYNSSKEREEDVEMQALRSSGLKSLEMQRYDNRRKIPLSDAVYRIDQSLERKQDPYLAITKLDLKYKTDSSCGVKEKTADLWKLLEDSYTEDVKYEALLVQYALSYLLKTGQLEDAFTLFKKSVSSYYSFSSEEPFWQQVQKNLSKMDLRLAEFAAYFAAYYNLYDEALRFYEYCVYESGGILQEGTVSPFVQTSTCMNLADLYLGSRETQKALDLYGRASGRETNSFLRSEIFCRLALIYASQNDSRSALRAIDYASKLYPGNAKAQVLKNKLKS